MFSRKKNNTANTGESAGHSSPVSLRQDSQPPAAAGVFPHLTDDPARKASLSPVPAILTGLFVLALFLCGVLLWTIYVPLKHVIIS